MDPTWILAILAGLQGLTSLFGGGGQQQTQQTTTQQDYPHVQDPLYWLTSPYVASNVLQNWDRYQGFGFPEGSQQVGTSDMLEQILKMIQENWPTIAGGFGGTNANKYNLPRTNISPQILRGL